MKIAIYKDTFANHRGADIAAMSLGDGLGSRGHEVSLVSDDVLAGNGDAFAGADIVIAAGTNELLRLHRDYESLLSRTVLQFHTDPAYQFRHWIKRWRRNRAIKTAMRKVAAIQVLLPAYVDYVKRIAPEVKVVVIGNAMPEPVETTASSKLIICPGALNPDKNQELLLKAFAVVSREFPDWRLDLYGVGKPKYADRLRSLACDAVSFYGYADLAPAYRDCAFVAFPSRTEGFGMVIAEAAAYGKPTVMIRDWIGTASAGGGIAAADDVSSFANALRELMSSPGRCESMGVAALDYCVSQYSRKSILDAWERCLEDVLP